METKIIKLKKFKFDEYFTISDKIDEYLSKLSDEIINSLPAKTDVQSISFLLYELLLIFTNIPDLKMLALR